MERPELGSGDDASWLRGRPRGARLLPAVLSGILILIIGVYRRAVSPLLGPSCRFHPTCSVYAVEAIRRHGPLSGSARAVARFLRCQPLNRGGYDPVA